ncbi:MAG: hypothetical protein QXU69_07145 [Thermofilaceae archaeon]
MAEIIVRKWVLPTYTQGYNPEVEVYLEVVNIGSTRVDVQVVDQVPATAVVTEQRGLTLEGNRLLANLTLPPFQHELLFYRLRFVESFHGYLGRARAFCGYLEVSSGEPWVWVDTWPNTAEGVSLRQPLGTPTGSRRVSFDLEEIPFHVHVQKEIIEAIKAGLSMLIVGPPDLWSGRLVEGAVGWAEKNGYEATLADEEVISYSSKVIGVRNLALFLVYNPGGLNQLRGSKDRGAVIIAASPRSLDELARTLHTRFLQAPFFEEVLRSLFDRTATLRSPTAEEFLTYFEKELGECINEEALKKLIEECEKRGVSCDEAELIVKKARISYKGKKGKLEPRDVVLLLTEVLSRRPRSRGEGHVE